jgi:hypothetical protein
MEGKERVDNNTTRDLGNDRPSETKQSACINPRRWIQNNYALIIRVAGYPIQYCGEEVLREGAGAGRHSTARAR